MKRKIAMLLLIAVICFGCGHGSKMLKNYDKWMKQADELAKTLCTHSEFSVCFWKATLGPDINKLPYEAIMILDQIEKTIKGKKYEDLTECEKATILGLWLRFTAMVSVETIKAVTPYLVKFVGMI